MKKSLPYIIIAIGLLGFYWYRYKHAPSIELIRIEATEMSSGKNIFLAEKINSPTIVHFYATWCGPCLKEMKTIKEEYQRIAASGYRIICISDDEPEKMIAMQNSMPETISFFRVASLKDLGIYSIPATYFTNEDGGIVKKQVEPCNWQDSKFLSEIKSLIK